MTADSSRSRLARGASIAAFGMVFQQAVAFASGLIVARVIGAAEYGVFNLARNLVQITSILTKLGLDLGLQRFLGAASVPDDLIRWKSRVMTLRLIGLGVSLIPCLIVLLGLGNWLEASVYRYDNFADVLLIVGLSLPFLTDLGILGGAYRGIKLISPSIKAEFILLPIFRLVLTLLLFAIGWRLWAAVVGSSVGVVLASAYLAWRARHDFPPSVSHGESRWTDCRQILGVSLVMAGAMLVTLLTRSVDMLLLGHYVSAADVGQYALAQMMLMVVALFGNAFGQSLGPLVAERFGAADLAGMGEVLRTNSRWVALVTAPIFAVFLTWGHELALLFGPSFAMPQAVVGWLGASALLVTLTASNGYALSMTGRHKSEFWLLCVGLLLAAICCAWAIPRWGQIGAAAGGFVALAVANLLRVGRVQRLFGVSTLDNKLVPIIALNVAAALGTGFLLQAVVESVLIRVPLGCTIFMLFSLGGTWLFGLNDTERSMLKKRVIQFRQQGLGRP